MTVRNLLISVVALAAGLLPGAAPAESKALLIGIGRYPALAAELPGVGVDIENMRVVAARLGFADDQVKVLEDSDATLPRIKAALHGWLAVDVAPEDQILVYYSGYGSNTGSNPAVAGYDVTADEQPGNVLPLREIDSALAALPCRQIYLVVDAAFAGDPATPVSLGSQRLGVDSGLIKHLPLLGQATSGAATMADIMQWSAANLVVLGARTPAVATTSGSVVTLAVRDAIDQALIEKAQINVNWLRDTAQDYVRADLMQALEVNVWGNSELAARALPVHLDQGDGPVWNFYLGLAKSGRELGVQGPDAMLSVDDRLELEVQVPVDGYLNVVSVDAMDQAVALFPNKYHRQNRVSRGVFRFPTERMDFDILAQPPSGRTLVVALLTSVPVDAYELTTNSRNDQGIVQDVFASLSGSATRAFRVVKRDAEAAAQTTKPSAIAPLYGAALEFNVMATGSRVQARHLPAPQREAAVRVAAVSGIPCDAARCR